MGRATGGGRYGAGERQGALAGSDQSRRRPKARRGDVARRVLAPFTGRNLSTAEGTIDAMAIAGAIAPGEWSDEVATCVDCDVMVCAAQTSL